MVALLGLLFVVVALVVTLIVIVRLRLFQLWRRLDLFGAEGIEPCLH